MFAVVRVLPPYMSDHRNSSRMAATWAASDDNNLLAVLRPIQAHIINAMVPRPRVIYT